MKKIEMTHTGKLHGYTLTQEGVDALTSAQGDELKAVLNELKKELTTAVTAWAKEAYAKSPLSLIMENFHAVAPADAPEEFDEYPDLDMLPDFDIRLSGTLVLSPEAVKAMQEDLTIMQTFASGHANCTDSKRKKSLKEGVREKCNAIAEQFAKIQKSDVNFYFSEHDVHKLLTGSTTLKKNDRQTIGEKPFLQAVESVIHNKLHSKPFYVTVFSKNKDVNGCAFTDEHFTQGGKRTQVGAIAPAEVDATPEPENATTEE